MYTDEWNVRISSFLGFLLYVSNSTDILDGILCFKDTEFDKTTIPEVFNTTCRVFGQYVIYYNERLPRGHYPSDYNEYAENDLCEVEVYGKENVNGFLDHTLLSLKIDPYYRLWMCASWILCFENSGYPNIKTPLRKHMCKRNIHVVIWIIDLASQPL